MIKLNNLNKYYNKGKSNEIHVVNNVNLELPTKFLCNDDCKGVCVMCGKNLNKDQCDCKKPIDPRLEGLLQFLE